MKKRLPGQQIEGQMSLFDFIGEKKVKLIRNNQYEPWRCNACGAECPNRIIYGDWPYQGVRISKKCPGCQREIEVPKDLQEIADRSNNYCTDSISRCNRTEIWEKAAGDCPQTCCHMCEKECEAKKDLICRYTFNVCGFSGHTCNKENLWEIADDFDDIRCPHVCCRICSTRQCGVRCNGSEEPKEPEDDYIRENPTCFYVFGYYLDRKDGWHKMSNDPPNFSRWHRMDVVVFGKITGTSCMQHERWEAKGSEFRSIGNKQNIETTEILAWKLSDSALKI
jgi:hypothetical protein